MSKRLSLLLLLMQWACTCMSQNAALAPKVLTVGVEQFYYAPHYYMENERYSGFGRDVLDLFATKKGYEFHYQPRPYVRVVKELLAGEIDFQYPDNRDWLADQKRGHHIYYSNGVVHYVDGISRRKADIGKPLSTLKRIAMPRGWTPIDYAPLAQRKELIIDEVNTVEGVIKMLLFDRVDGIYLNADVVNAYLEVQGQSSAAGFDESLPYQFSQFSLSTTSHPEIIKEFNRFLVDNAAEIQKIKTRYKFKFDIDPKRLRK